MTDASAEGEATNLEGMTPDSWLCVDCGFDTAPGLLDRAEMEQAMQASGEEGVSQTIDHKSEVYTVRDAIWKLAGMEAFGGCLCIGSRAPNDY
jgi:hypothetical protein